MKKLNKIKEAQIYIGDPDEVSDIKPQLDKGDKLFVMGDKMNEDENVDGNEEPPMFVEYLSDIKNETPFKLGDSKWEYVWAKYPNNKKNIGVYRFEHDLVYGYEWFKNHVLSEYEKENVKPDIEEADGSDSDSYGLEGRDMNELKNDVKILFDRLNFAPIQNALKKINTPIEKYEVVSQFAENIGIPREKLPELITNLKNVGYQQENVYESKNPKMTKGALLEHIRNIKHNQK